MTIWRGALALLVALAMSGAAWSAEELAYGPPPEWVKVLETPEAPAERSTAEAAPASAVPAPTASTPSPGVRSSRRLLSDQQLFFAPGRAETFMRSVSVAQAARATDQSELSLFWLPASETLTVHWARVTRSGRPIDLLADRRFETVMVGDRARPGMARLNIAVEAGDVIDLAYTRVRTVKDSDMLPTVGRDAGDTTTRTHRRLVWDDGTPLYWQAAPEVFGEAKVSRQGGRNEVVFDNVGLTATVVLPAGAPARYRSGKTQIRLSRFADWAQVSSHFHRLLPPTRSPERGSPLADEVQKIRQTHRAPLDRALAAKALVVKEAATDGQPVELGDGMTFEQVLARRVEDQVRRATMLMTLLQGLNIPAEPVLVSSDQDLEAGPADASKVNLAAVRVQIGGVGRLLYLDESSELMALSFFGIGGARYLLPVRAERAVLKAAPEMATGGLQMRVNIAIDARRGLDQPPTVRQEVVLSGPVAEYIGPRAEAEKAEMISAMATIPGLGMEIKDPKRETEFDPVRRELRLISSGDGALTWQTIQPGFRELRLSGTTLRAPEVPVREPGPWLDAPFANSAMLYDMRLRYEIMTPSTGPRLAVLGARAVDIESGGVRYRRTVQQSTDRVVVEIEQIASRGEFPASEADTVRTARAKLPKRGVALRTRLPMTATPPQVVAAEPTTAQGFAARAASYFSTGNHASAVADFTRAIELEPAQARHLYNRGAVYYQMRKDAEARADFEASLALNAASTAAMLGLAELHLTTGRRADADALFARAIAAGPDDGRMLNRRAEAYESSGDLSSALADFEMIASKHPDFARDERVAVDICRLRSRLRAELSIVLESCKDMTGAGAAEARGLALLRAGQDAEALKAFSDGLVVQPVHAGLLYGRGIVRLRQGQWEDGDDDIAFARALNSQIGANFERYGVAAP